MESGKEGRLVKLSYIVGFVVCDLRVLESAGQVQSEGVEGSGWLVV